MRFVPTTRRERLVSLIVVAVVVAATVVGLAAVSSPEQVRDEAVTTPPARPVPPPIASLSDVLDRYWRASGPATLAVQSVSQLQSIVAEIQQTAPRWVGPPGAADEPRKRLAVAAFSLELIDTNYRFAWAPNTGAALLDWVCTLVRRGDPVPEEEAWHVAAIGLSERLEEGLGRHVDHAEGRFPGRGRWALARAVDEEQSTWPTSRDGRASSLPEYYERRLSSRFTDAMARGLNQEAHLRWGYLQLRLERHASALTHFEQVGTPTDPFLRYWVSLFRGRAFEGLRRIPEAIEAYRIATLERPGAQSATLALAAALVADRRRADARGLVERMVSMPSPPFDPWTIYMSPDYRFVPGSIAALRRAMAP